MMNYALRSTAAEIVIQCTPVRITWSRVFMNLDSKLVFQVLLMFNRLDKQLAHVSLKTKQKAN